jgi:hypothetical protein
MRVDFFASLRLCVRKQGILGILGTPNQILKFWGKFWGHHTYIRLLPPLLVQRNPAAENTS